MRRPSRLLVESEAWLRDGVITDAQRRAILARYEPAATDALQASAVLTWLGAGVAAIGAIVLVARNWASVPAAVKVLLTAGPMIGLYLWLDFAIAPIAVPLGVRDGPATAVLRVLPSGRVTLIGIRP